MERCLSPGGPVGERDLLPERCGRRRHGGDGSRWSRYDVVTRDCRGELSMTVELICFDMAGTTVNDHGLVLEAFRRTIEELDVVGEEATKAEAYVVETMGQSKMEVFSALFDDRAEVANEAFERHFVKAAHGVGVSEVPGAREAIESLKSRGIAVAFTTGFSPATREALIELLGWSDLITLRVSPADAGRGRPAPD